MSKTSDVVVGADEAFERIEADLKYFEFFEESFFLVGQIGSGGDGVIYSYEHLDTKQLIAVKSPVEGDESSYKWLMREIENFQILGNHENIVHFFTYNVGIPEIPTGIFLEYCTLGDLYDYRKAWCNQERKAGRPKQPSELTIWKLLNDMSLGLDFIHNMHDTQYVHNDLKPGNILVTARKATCADDGLPVEPVFKLTDFARLVPFPTPPQDQPLEWWGTPEFAPPLEEQKAPVRPSADMWSLGATVQLFALGVDPIQSTRAVLHGRHRKRLLGENVPDMKSWDHIDTRNTRLTVYRPLNVSAMVLTDQYDLHPVLKDYNPYSAPLNNWYAALWRTDEAERVTSKDLVKHLVPAISGNLEIEVKIRQAAESFAMSAGRASHII